MTRSPSGSGDPVGGDASTLRLVEGEVPDRGACYGFGIRSVLEFSYLRAGPGATLPVREAAVRRPPSARLLQEWGQVPGKRTATRLFRADDGAFWVEIAGHRFRVDADQPGIDLLPSREVRRREMMLWTTPAAVAVVGRGDLAVHGAAVEIEGRAVALIAESGRGKSTTAAAFLDTEARVLADDFVCCRPSADPVVYPGPAVVRLHRDSVDRLGIEAEAILFEDGVKAHVALPEAARGTGDAVPLSAVVFLETDADELAMRPVQPADALKMLWASSFYLPTDEGRAACFGGLAELVDRVPVWTLSRAVGWDGLPPLVDLITRTVRGP